MFNFFKNKKDKEIINEINNEHIITMLVGYGVLLLKRGEDFENIATAKCIFGYCITGVDGNIDSLFKIETDKITAYYQAIRGEVFRLTINEDMFNSAIELFYSNHKDFDKVLGVFEVGSFIKDNFAEKIQKDV